MATTLSSGTDPANKPITTYLRKAFAAPAAAPAALALRVLRDDGVVVYLNGIEAGRSNMPNGPVTGATLASSTVGGADEAAWFTVPVAASLLLPGQNVLAIELHQASPDSSDLAFDLALDALSLP
jgi:hypothetical protein